MVFFKGSCEIMKRSWRILGESHGPVFAKWLYPKEKETSHIFMTGGPFATWSKELTNFRFLPSCCNWEIGVPPPLLVKFQRDVSQILEKDIPGL